MKKCRRLAQVALIATAAQLVASNIAVAATCASPAEKAALDARVLQSELMVAALTCGENARYNAFVQKFEPELVGFGKALRSYFARAYGKAGENELNQFVTRLANGATIRRTQFTMPQYCASAVNLFNSVLSVELSGLRDFAGQAPFASDSGIESCAVQAAREPAN
ncbi:MAG TPA: hypothetical protein VI732_00505 [Alphaproteobacteria bacterium]|jgi:hypothetical protein|nr:hypothetical protein [Alphaproteobacteria bacterium]